MKENIVIFGTGEIAEVAHHYFSKDSNYTVVGFTVEREYLNRESFCDLRVVPFEDLLDYFDPSSCEIFVALGYSQINQLRARIFHDCKSLGFKLASYVSSKAFVSDGVYIGENCFILEDNTIQPFVELGENVFLWSGNHIGHHAKIGNHVFISSHVVVSGGVEIGDYCFVGVNATFRDHITIGKKTVVGARALIMKDALDEGVYIERSTLRSETRSSALNL